MPDIFAALPTRPLHARPPSSIGGTFWGAVSVLFLVAVLFGTLYYMLFQVAPGLLTDWQVRPRAVIVRGAHVTDGECDSKLFIEMCGATLTAQHGTDTIERRVHHIYGSFDTGDVTVNVVADPAHPDWLTTDKALDVFWNRVVTFAAVTAFMLAVVVFGGWSAVLGRRSRRAWMKAESVAVPLQLKSTQPVRGGSVWTVVGENGASARWTLPRKAKPFVLGPANRILGLAMRGGASIMPLDAGLRWVDLSREERDTLLRAKAGPAR